MSIDQLSRDYGEAIRAAIEGSIIRRIEEIEGRVPSLNEVREHGTKEIGPQAVMHLWKGEPIVEYVPAGYDLDGWHDAVISEVRQRTILDPV